MFTDVVVVVMELMTDGKLQSKHTSWSAFIYFRFVIHSYSMNRFEYNCDDDMDDYRSIFRFFFLIALLYSALLWFGFNF